jgi:glucose-6-phosphate isomerase
MSFEIASDLPVWKEMVEDARRIDLPENHLKHLIRSEGRLEAFSLRGGGLYYDFSRQRIDSRTMELLFRLARERKAREQFESMVTGEKINTTENRAALHTALRDFSGQPVLMDGKDVMPEIRRVRDQIREFAGKVHSAAITGSTGKRFTHAVVIGIGGSYLGPQFVAEALRDQADRDMELHFLANVDIHNFGAVVSRIDPEATLWIVISKSYTTAETLANTRQAYDYMQARGLDPAKHVVTVTSKGSPGDDPSNPVLAAFHMYDFIGGRYSVTSAVGGVPLALVLGYDRFERFLKGAEEMDRHARQAAPEKNLPLMAALISVWNNDFLGYPVQAIIPYANPLSRLTAHIQQLNMESNGKAVTCNGLDLDFPTGPIVFGEPGTNAQHSFFQLAHQGRPFPIDFIGVIRPGYKQFGARSKGVTNHQELWSNLIAQPAALADGKDHEDPARRFPGNRPSATILLEDLSPESIGRLLAFYEHRTVFEAFIWGNNPFDQFGVELGKTLASGNRRAMARKNDEPGYGFEDMDPISRFYMKTLFKGEIG